MTEEKINKPSYRIQDSPTPQSPRSPLAEYTAKTKGDKLYIKPKFVTKFNATSGLGEISEIESKDLIHQRSSTTIINDISQSYTFAPGKKTQESCIEEDESENSLERIYSDIKDSIMGSTIDPKCYNRKYQRREYNSAILTVSSESQEESKVSDKKNNLLMPVTAFCEECGENVMTDVVENVYTGSFWEKLVCSFCLKQNNLKEFTHICQVCQRPVFQVKLKMGNV